MSLSALLTAVVEYVGDELVNTCDRPAPGRVLRYFGTAGLPQDLGCDSDGVLSISFDRGYPSEAFPADSSSRPPSCTAFPVYVVAIRYDVCWTEPEIDPDGITLIDDTWDADAAMLSDVADCIARALIHLTCGTATSEKAQAVVDAARGCDKGLAYKEVVPSVGGGAARIVWRMFLGPKSAT